MNSLNLIRCNDYIYNYGEFLWNITNAFLHYGGLFRHWNSHEAWSRVHSRDVFSEISFWSNEVIWHWCWILILEVCCGGYANVIVDMSSVAFCPLSMLQAGGTAARLLSLCLPNPGLSLRLWGSVTVLIRSGKPRLFTYVREFSNVRHLP